jgi:glycosyltransferase involved in cell wall biosynthesis
MRDLARSYPTVGQFHDIGSFSRERSPGGPIDRDRPVGLIPKLRCAVQSLIKANLLAAWRRLSRIVVPSTYLRDLAARHGFSPERLRVISNFCLSKGTNSHTPTDPPLILFVGSLLHIKGVHLLLEALARLTDHRWRAIIVGEGDEEDRLLAQAEALALSERVTFAGNLDRDDIAALYSRCRMLVHTSTIPESFGLVGIEAMSHGRPVVGFRLGGVSEWLLDHETGLAVEPWSVAALANGMLTLLQDPALATRLGAAARVRTQALFTPDRFLDNTLAVYAEAISDWRRRS